MQRVVVTAETVQGSLILACLLLDNGIRFAVRRNIGSSSSTTVSSLLGSTKVTRTANEQSELVLENNFTRLIPGRHTEYNRGALALVSDF